MQALLTQVGSKSVYASFTCPGWKEVRLCCAIFTYQRLQEVRVCKYYIPRVAGSEVVVQSGLTKADGIKSYASLKLHLHREAGSKILFSTGLQKVRFYLPRVAGSEVMLAVLPPPRSKPTLQTRLIKFLVYENLCMKMFSLF